MSLELEYKIRITGDLKKNLKINRLGRMVSGNSVYAKTEE